MSAVVLASASQAEGNFLMPNGTFFVVLIIFLIVLGVIGTFVVPPISKVLKERDNMVTKTTADNKKSAEQFDAAREDYEAAMADARVKASAFRDEARAELARAGELIRRLERITTAWTRGMYAARIDCWRGDPGSAAAILSEGLDGYDGPEWDGTETGAQWWERTKAEEGL